MAKKLSKFNLEREDLQILNTWDYSKNNKPPNLYFRSSKDRVWWICDRNHSWQASIFARSIVGQGCPYCANKKACSDNCLLTINPNLCEEWNYDKNTLLPNQVLPYSKKKVWWKCKDCNFEWQAIICDRSNGTKCTRCNYGYTLRDRSLIYSEDKLQKQCKICEHMLNLYEFRLKGNKQKGYWENNICRKCDAAKIKDYRLTDKGIAAEIVRRTKYVSKKNNLKFDLTVDWILERLNNICWNCELTGLPMRKNREKVSDKHEGFMWDSISIDKIIPENGYIKTNVRFTLNIINLFKHKGTDERMYMLASKLLENRK